jgi:hypothetical protein
MLTLPLSELNLVLVQAVPVVSVDLDLYLGNNLVLLLVKYVLWFGALLLGCNEGRVLPSYGIFQTSGVKPAP